MQAGGAREDRASSGLRGRGDFTRIARELVVADFHQEFPDEVVRARAADGGHVGGQPAAEGASAAVAHDGVAFEPQELEVAAPVVESHQDLGAEGGELAAGHVEHDLGGARDGEEKSWWERREGCVHEPDDYLGAFDT